MKVKYNEREIELKEGVTPREIANIFNVDTKEFFAAKVNGEPWDLDRPIYKDAIVSFLSFNDKEGKEIFWHSTAHILATAIKHLYPNALPTIGPAIDEGFYYDFFNLPIGDKDLPKIEEEMRKIIAKNAPFKRSELSREEAKSMFSYNKFKEEILNETPEIVSIYRDDDFVDLCTGPHVPSTGYIKAVKLLKVSGSYWRGDPKRETLTRIYGISFPSKEQLEEYIKILEERARRDHKLLGKEMELFMFTEYSPGSPIYLPRGWFIYRQLMRLAEELDEKYGYQLVKTPFIAKSQLWKITGHYAKYKENMFGVYPFSELEELGENKFKVVGDEYALKPMSCPFHVLIFKAKPRSYRDLPMRIAEFGWVHRYELEGTLDGLKRTRVIHQQDAHIFVREDQIEDEVEKVLQYAQEVYSMFNIKYKLVLATRPEKRIGSEELWDKAESALKRILEKRGDYEIKPGDGAFYGPKIDIYYFDFTGKPEYAAAIGTVQLDFNIAPEFDAYYIDKDDKQKYPVVIHRAIMGSFNRFMGVLIEHFAGNLPVWISPEQVRVLSISDKVRDYAEQIYNELKRSGIRTETDVSATTLQKKIREAQILRIPYMIIIGEEEKKNGTISVRMRNGVTVKGLKLEKFIARVKEKVEKREIDDKLE